MTVRTEGPGAPRSPYVFVVGCPRSGTTLLQRMLDNHPDLVVANDTHFIPRALPGEGAVAGDPVLTPDLVERIVTYRRFERLGVDRETARRLAEGAATYAELVSRLYAEVARRRGKPWAGEKTPDYGRHLPLLHVLFPWARVIHIVRDGRDVALSTLDWATPEKGPGRFGLWASEPLAVCALWWRWQVGTAHRDGQALGPPCYREVRYEDLIGDPAGVIGELVAFLGLPPSDLVLRYHEGRVSHRPGISAKRAWLPPTSGPPRLAHLDGGGRGRAVRGLGRRRARPLRLRTRQRAADRRSPTGLMPAVAGGTPSSLAARGSGGPRRSWRRTNRDERLGGAGCPADGELPEGG